MKQGLLVLLVGFLACGPASAQFREDFDGPSLPTDPRALDGWAFFSGDGTATMDLRQGDGYASILVDATKDRHNIWWALIKRKVSDNLDLHLLNEPSHELRIEARIRTSHAPRRVNLHLNTQRTTDFHTHLMEFDLPDTTRWHTISMTTDGFDAVPGDTVYGQLALMDWGRDRYRVDVDYFKVDVVDAAQAGPDLGEPLPYHPPIPDPQDFTQHVAVAQDAMIDRLHPDLTVNPWYAHDEAGPIPVLTVSGTQFVILRWDLSAFAGKRVDGLGLLELTTYAVQSASQETPEFGSVRVVEILGGDPEWDQKTVTYNSLRQGHDLSTVLNPQMIIDVKAAEAPGGQTFIPIPRPVLQRLIDGTTLGFALRPLGAIQASFFASEHQDGIHSARLHFTVRE